jgi:hypothetical protein
VALVLVAVYVAAAVGVGRRFGVRGLWAVWIGGIVVGTLFPFVVHGESIAHFEHASLIHHTAVLAVPMGISAWVIARTLRRPRPAGVPVQLALGALAFILSFLVMFVAILVLIATH